MVAISSYLVNYFYPEMRNSNPDDSLLHHAVKTQEIEKVDALIAKGYNPVKKDSFGYSPLEYAVFQNNEDTVFHLLAQEPSQVKEIKESLHCSSRLERTNLNNLVSTFELFLNDTKTKKLISTLSKFFENFQKLSSEIKNLELLVQQENEIKPVILDGVESLLGDSSNKESLEQVEKPHLFKLEQEQNGLIDGESSATLSTHESVLENLEFKSPKEEIEYSLLNPMDNSRLEKQSLRTPSSQKLLDLNAEKLDLESKYADLLSAIGNNLLISFIAKLPLEEVRFLLEKCPELLTTLNSDHFNIVHFAALNPSNEVILEVLKHAKEIPPSNLCKVSPLQLFIYQVQKKDPLQLQPFERISLILDGFPIFAAAMSHVLPYFVLDRVDDLLKTLQKWPEMKFALDVLTCSQEILIYFAMGKKFEGDTKRLSLFLSYLIFPYFFPSYASFFDLIKKAHIVYFFVKESCFAIKNSLSQIEGRPHRFIINNSVRVLNTIGVLDRAISTLARQLGSTYLGIFLKDFKLFFSKKVDLEGRLAHIDRTMQRKGEYKLIEDQALYLSQVDLDSPTLKNDFGRFYRKCALISHPDKIPKETTEEMEEQYKRFFGYCTQAQELLSPRKETDS